MGGNFTSCYGKFLFTKHAACSGNYFEKRQDFPVELNKQIDTETVFRIMDNYLNQKNSPNETKKRLNSFFLFCNLIKLGQSFDRENNPNRYAEAQRFYIKARLIAADVDRDWANNFELLKEIIKQIRYSDLAAASSKKINELLEQVRTIYQQTEQIGFSAARTSAYFRRNNSHPQMVYKFSTASNYFWGFLVQKLHTAAKFILF